MLNVMLQLQIFQPASQVSAALRCSCLARLPTQSASMFTW